MLTQSRWTCPFTLHTTRKGPRSRRTEGRIPLCHKGLPLLLLAVPLPAVVPSLLFRLADALLLDPPRLLSALPPLPVEPSAQRAHDDDPLVNVVAEPGSITQESPPSRYNPDRGLLDLLGPQRPSVTANSKGRSQWRTSTRITTVAGIAVARIPTTSPHWSSGGSTLRGESNNSDLFSVSEGPAYTALVLRAVPAPLGADYPRVVVRVDTIMEVWATESRTGSCSQLAERFAFVGPVWCDPAKVAAPCAPRGACRAASRAGHPSGCWPRSPLSPR